LLEGFKAIREAFDAGINIQMISTSEIKISVLIDIAQSEKAVNAVHDKFID
ncbi:MAG: aspartate kinase, partial [Oscillospiraceae bacterium]